MEKYARQAIAEGIKTPEDLLVTIDSELYRVLNLHYNRNNQIEVCTLMCLIGVNVELLNQAIGYIVKRTYGFPIVNHCQT